MRHSIDVSAHAPARREGRRGPTLRLVSLVVAFAISLVLWALLLSGCRSRQSDCADCYIGLQHMERSR